MVLKVNGIPIPDGNDGQYIEDIDFDEDGNQIIVETESDNYNEQIEGDTTTVKIKSLYTDGACSGNPGPGGWGAVICFADGSCHELGGAEPQTTNNRMELQAAIAALEFFANSGQTEPVTLYTDSLYVKSGITKWIQSWKNKGWKTRANKDVLNQDLWHLLDKLNSPQVKWEHVRSHSGDFYNDRCDEIARSFSHNLTPELQQLSLANTLKQSYGVGDEKFKALISDFCRKPRDNN